MFIADICIIAILALLTCIVAVSIYAAVRTPHRANPSPSRRTFLRILIAMAVVMAAAFALLPVDGGTSAFWQRTAGMFIVAIVLMIVLLTAIAIRSRIRRKQPQQQSVTPPKPTPKAP